MKKLLTLFLIGLGITAHAQCTISGPASLTSGQTATYSVPASLAQCTECYDWDVTSGSVTINGSDQNNTVSITQSGTGNSVLALTWFDETGCHNCTFNVTGPAAPACCTPIATMRYTCRGSSPATLGGFVFIKSPAGCTINWSTVQKIDMDLSGAVLFSGDTALNGLNHGTVYPPFQFDTLGSVYDEFYYSGGCLPNIVCYIKVYFNNGCPPVNITVQAFSNPRPAPQAPIIVSPNPSRSAVNFEGEALENYLISIYDANGNAVIENSKIDQSLDISTQKKGIYFYKIFDAEGFTQDGKIIKE